MVGDFNMIEALEDQVGGSRVRMHGAELAAWERFCMSLRIDDLRGLERTRQLAVLSLWSTYTRLL